jgi:carbon monoxide dehydrogenase subunit G
VVKASPEAAWNFLTNPVRVARCLPGAAITNQVDERTHAGTITVKVGPVTATYKGTMQFERLDPDARTAEIVATGQDMRGKGGAQLRMTSALVEKAPGQTEVTITSHVNVMGLLAQLGRGMIQDVSDQMFATFVTAARAELERPETSTHPTTGSSGGNAASSGPITPAIVPEHTPVSPREAAPPVEVLSFGSAAVGRAAGRAAAKPPLWIGIGVLLVFLWWWLG